MPQWRPESHPDAQARRLLRTSIDDLPFLRDQVATQKETIRTLQEQAKLSKQLMQIERSVYFLPSM